MSVEGFIDDRYGPMTRGFVRAIEQYAQDHDIAMVSFEKGQRKDNVANQRRSEFHKPEGVVFIGKASGKVHLLPD